VDRALPFALRGIFRNAGQVCTAGSRLFLHRAIHDEFLEKLIGQTAALKTGHGLDDGVDVGPLISRTQLDRVLSYVVAGRQDGAKLEIGGERLGGVLKDGYFVEPTIFSNVRNEMRIAQEEIFGPVLSIIPFESDQELVELANANRYGLAAAIWTSDLSRAHRLARKLEAGSIWVNGYNMGESSSSFGGFKQSGFGRELGLHSVELYTELKTVTVAL
jgi:aldehyde dehydrogenase (NAD+)/phenylacetaldehyde dehydrogenase